MKGAVDIYASIIIMVISITFASTLYLYSSGVIKGTMIENFKLVDIFGNRVIIKNIGREEIKGLKCIVDGVEKGCHIVNETEKTIAASITPGQTGKVLIDGISSGIHELQISTKSMSQRLTWNAEPDSIVAVPTETTTNTIPPGVSVISELSVDPQSFQIPQTVTVKCKALRGENDENKILHLDISLNNPSGNEIFTSPNLGNDQLDKTYNISSSNFTEPGDYKVICNLRETKSLWIDEFITSKDANVNYNPWKCNTDEDCPQPLRCENGICVIKPETTTTTMTVPCGICYSDDGAGGCVAQSTNWGDNLYKCIGDDKMCFNGICHDCSDEGGFLYDDGCNGCAGQGGKACWREGSSGQSCDTVCSPYGKCVAANWNDYLPPPPLPISQGCTVCKHFTKDNYLCQYNLMNYAPYYVLARCQVRSSSSSYSQSCSAKATSSIRFCVCEYSTAPLTTTTSTTTTISDGEGCFEAPSWFDCMTYCAHKGLMSECDPEWSDETCCCVCTNRCPAGSACNGKVQGQDCGTCLRCSLGCECDEPYSEGSKDWTYPGVCDQVGQFCYGGECKTTTTTTSSTTTTSITTTTTIGATTTTTTGSTTTTTIKESKDCTADGGACISSPSVCKSVCDPFPGDCYAGYSQCGSKCCCIC